HSSRGELADHGRHEKAGPRGRPCCWHSAYGRASEDGRVVAVMVGTFSPPALADNRFWSVQGCCERRESRAAARRRSEQRRSFLCNRRRRRRIQSAMREQDRKLCVVALDTQGLAAYTGAR